MGKQATIKNAWRQLLICIALIALIFPLNVEANNRLPECEIDQNESKVVIRVYKEGKLSAFGDNHLISTSALEGKLELNHDMPEKSSIFLAVPTQSLIVNDPGLRAAAEPEFNTRVSALNRKITRKSMLGKRVLHARKYPHIRIQSQSLPHQLSGTARMAITLRDATLVEEVALETVILEDQITIRGQFELKQSEYGIAPFSIMFGGIRVKDILRLNFDLLARCPAS